MIQDVAPDSLRRVVGDVFTQPEYQWVVRRRPLLAWVGDLWRQLLDWLYGVQDQHPAAFRLLLVGLILVLLLLLAHVAYVVWRIVRPATGDGTPAAGGGALRVEDARSYLARAERLAREGRFAEALGHRFLAVVLELQEARAARFHVSKTPAEYVDEVRLDAEGRATFAGLVARLYRHLFGAVPCDEAAYREFGSAAERVRGHVVPA